MATQSTLPAVTEGMCAHIAVIVIERRYERGPDGKLKVKTCKGPSRQVLRDVCGHTSPVGADACYSCGSTDFDENPVGIVELEVCHSRCPRCKKVTKGCDVKACANCGATKLSPLPPAVNPDVYGFDVVNP